MVRAVTGSQRWQKVGEVFDRALGVPEAERDDFLVQECGTDVELLNQVRELLAAHHQPGAMDRLSERVATEINAAMPDGVRAAKPGEQIGPYRVLARLGSGGMGVVYLATREGEGFQQRVAIKVLHQAMMGEARGLMPRFLSERSILARLEHPNIPRFLDGGLTRDGAPYIAMEYVEGTPINTYSDERNFSIRQRLSLFVAVCDAMQYAHQHLVVHRDLKPSNILVTHGGVPKVLDFGIAKILDVANQDVGAETDAGQRWMTPDYASPEQVRGEPVTTAADVFALGVLLYEMISCARPHAGKSRYELERAILEHDPVRPSEALAGDKCVARGFNPAKLRREIAGDLDTIALKALNKAPDRRYRTAGELGDDIRRYLAGFPVHARADTLFYRASKYVTRHRMLVAALGFGVVSLLVGFVGTAVAWHRMRDAARLAAQERDRAEQVSHFAVGLFAGADPLRTAVTREVSAGSLLDSGAARLRRELRDQPERRAALLMVLAQSYRGLGRFDEALATIDEVIRLRRLAIPRQPAELASALEEQASVHILRERPDSAVRALSEALVLRRQSNASDSTLARVYDLLGEFFHVMNQVDSAEHYFRASLATWNNPSDSARAYRYSTLAMIEARRGRWAAAESLQLRAYETLKAAMPTGSHALAAALDGVVFMQYRMGKIKEARVRQRDVLAAYERSIGLETFDAANAMAVMANIALADNDADSAAYWWTRSIVIKRKIRHSNPGVARSMLNFAALRRRQGNLRAADTLAWQALQLRREAYGERHLEVADAQLEVAAVRIAQGRFGEARTLIGRARQSLTGDRVPKQWIARADSLAAVVAGKRE